MWVISMLSLISYSEKLILSKLGDMKVMLGPGFCFILGRFLCKYLTYYKIWESKAHSSIVLTREEVGVMGVIKGGAKS